MWCLRFQESDPARLMRFAQNSIPTWCRTNDKHFQILGRMVRRAEVGSHRLFFHFMVVCILSMAVHPFVESLSGFTYVLQATSLALYYVDNVLRFTRCGGGNADGLTSGFARNMRHLQLCCACLHISYFPTPALFRHSGSSLHGQEGPASSWAVETRHDVLPERTGSH